MDLDVTKVRRILSEAQLRSLIGSPSALVSTKIQGSLNHTTRPFVERSPFVFGGGRAAPGAFAIVKRRIDAEVAHRNNGEAISHWTLHDIRQTVATQLAELKIAPYIVEAILNHKTGAIRGVAAIYNRYDYAAEKRQALDAWARRLDAIVNPAPASNVVEIRRAAL